MHATTSLFVDLGNLYFCVNKKWPGRRLDFDKFHNFLKQRTGEKVFRAFAYGIEVNDEARGFKHYLRTAGFDPKFKRHQFRELGEDYRTDWTIGLTLDVVNSVKRVECIVLCSSNPEFAPLVEWVKSQGVRCIVCACGIAKKLRHVADECIEVHDELLQPAVSKNGDKPSIT